MALLDDLQVAVRRFFRDAWDESEGTAVPDAEDVRLYNHGVRLNAVVLYADIAESTKMVDEQLATFAAEVYKSFLYCAARIIVQRGGVVTAYDGDRIMGVFVGDAKNSSAARAALNINHAAQKVVMPALRDVYDDDDFVLRHCVGVDASELLVARTGVRGANDLVWVGRAANYAAKFSALRVGGYRSIISKRVYDNLNKTSKYSTKNGEDRWESLDDEVMAGVKLYGSTWWWSV